MNRLEGAVVRRARKTWTCTGNGAGARARYSPGCPGVIRPGERHVEYLGETAAYQVGPRICAACALEFGYVEPVELEPPA